MINKILEEEFEIIYKNFELKDLKDKIILITGANGLVGSYLVDLLLYMNYQYNFNIKVFAMSRSLQTLKKRFAYHKNLTLIEQDLNKSLQIQQKFDYVIHAASNAHPLAFSKNPVETMKTNLLGTINLLDMLINTNTKFLYISTGEIYGNNFNGIAFTEDYLGWIDSKLCRSCYPESKRAAETLCVAYHHQYHIHTNIARLCYVYGPMITEDNSRADAQFLRNAMEKKDIVMKSDGLQKRTYCYIADVASAILTIITKSPSAEVYNIANNNSIISIKEYAYIMAKLANVKLKFELPDKTEQYGYSKEADSLLDASKIMKLGWKPLYDIKKGLQHTLQIKSGDK